MCAGLMGREEKRRAPSGNAEVNRPPEADREITALTLVGGHSIGTSYRREIQNVLCLCVAVSVLAALAVATPGCEKRKAPTYSVQISNRTSEQIRDAGVVYPDGFTTAGGILVPDGQKFEAGIKRPVPQSVRVKWSDGKASHSLDVDVSMVREDFDGSLEFEIQSDGTVKFSIHEAWHPGDR